MDSRSTSDDLSARRQRLEADLRGLERVLVAFSGGVDSAFLVAATHAAGIPYLAVTARSLTMPARDLADALALVTRFGWNHRLIDSQEMADPAFTRNAPDRCFHCKNELFGRLTELAAQEGFAHVLDGTTLDDLNDYRPGMQAKQRHAVVSPLLGAGLSKADVRALSRAAGLPTWDKPASPCLSSRIPYGEPIIPESLRMVEAAENGLRALGFATLRVRKQGQTARIELPVAQIPRLLDGPLRQEVIRLVRDCGFGFVTLDLEGFSSGKLNRVIPLVQRGSEGSLPSDAGAPSVAPPSSDR
ncbi:MAG: ATP-dependent sacrificial sulfur transferase LarE [Magnetococcales bacterium]|nr:ATP-dependent sacrificial sulfur transferase LarE [Magnetococcales bacterium]